MFQPLRVVALVAAAAVSLPAADKWAENYNIPLWPEGKVPMAKDTGPLDNPFLTVFMPPENKRNGTSVIVAPGGSNIMLMYGGEGIEVAERLNDWGIAAFVLTYRMSPRYDHAARSADGHKAVEIVRSRAAEWKLNPDRIGFAGFSAGSEIARAMATSSPAEKPNFLVLVYSVGRPEQGEDFKTFPPTFMVSAAGDRGPANGSAQLFLDLNRAGATAEIHLYQKGRHGFGAAYTSPEFGPWMPALQHFLEIGGFIPGGRK